MPRITYDKYFDQYFTNEQMEVAYKEINNDAVNISNVFKGSAVSKKLARRVAKKIAKSLHKNGDNLEDFKDRQLQQNIEEKGFAFV